jgi:hypothetical protein
LACLALDLERESFQLLRVDQANLMIIEQARDAPEQMWTRDSGDNDELARIAPRTHLPRMLVTSSTAGRRHGGIAMNSGEYAGSRHNSSVKLGTHRPSSA